MDEITDPSSRLRIDSLIINIMPRAVMNPVSPIQIPLTSDVTDVRPNAQANGRASFYFFMTAILGQPCSLELAQFLQAVQPTRPVTVLLPRLRLKAFASDFLLWNSIQAAPRRIAVPDVVFQQEAIPEPVRWLFGQVSIVPPVTWAPDIILTSNPADARGSVFDAQRR